MSADPSAIDPAKTHLVKDLVHDRALVSCRFDAQGRFVFAGSEDNSVVCWDLASGAKTVLAAHDSWPHALASTPDGQTLLTGACDGRLIWWPCAAEKPSPSRTIEAHAGWVNSVAVSPDGKLIATAGNDRLVKLWSAEDGSLIQELPGHPKYVYQATFDPSGRFLASADIAGLVILWDVSVRKEARRLDAGKLSKYDQGQGVDYGGARGLAFSADGQMLFVAGLIEASNPLGAVSNPALVAIDTREGGAAPFLHRPKDDLKGVAWGVKPHPGGFLIAVTGGTGGGALLFWKPGEVNEFARVALPNTGRALDLHPDAIRVATAHHDGHVRIWSLTEKPPG